MMVPGIDDMKLFRTLALVGGYRPRSQKRYVAVVHTQISVRVDYGLGLKTRCPLRPNPSSPPGTTATITDNPAR
jgi:hypothetical protein